MELTAAIEAMLIIHDRLGVCEEWDRAMASKLDSEWLEEFTWRQSGEQVAVGEVDRDGEDDETRGMVLGESRSASLKSFDLFQAPVRLKENFHV
jgi:hypothetical protein